MYVVCMALRSQIVLFELVRQNFVHCEERGALLERIRARYLNLRQEVLALGESGVMTIGQ
jgi:hypothetical protein